MHRAWTAIRQVLQDFQAVVDYRLKAVFAELHRLDVVPPRDPRAREACDSVDEFVGTRIMLTGSKFPPALVLSEGKMAPILLLVIEARMYFVICENRWLPSPTGMPSGHVAHSAISPSRHLRAGTCQALIRVLLVSIVTMHVVVSFSPQVWALVVNLLTC